MSAPDTNLKKQKRRHRGPLWGIIAALVLAAILFVGYLAYTVDTETPAPPPAAQQDAPAPALPVEGTEAAPITDPEVAPQDAPSSQ